MRIACISYRDWALEIYDQIVNITNNTCLIIRSRDQFSEEVISDFKPDVILFYGWSWIVSENITSKFKCVMLHPSPLPKYRGGSPIQNQIIAGEKESKVTLFFMNEEMDAGDIIAQKHYSLDGSLADVLKRITKIGIELTLQHIVNVDNIFSTPQNSQLATYCKRRKPSDSEITIEELMIKPAEFIYNKIRMLADPYPNAYIKTIDNKLLYIKEVFLKE